MSVSVELTDKARQVELVRYERVSVIGSTVAECMRNFVPSQALYGNLKKRYWDRMKSAEESGKYRVKELVIHRSMGHTVH